MPSAEYDEALKQIEAINEAIESSHQFLMSGTVGVGFGLILIFVPFLENALQKCLPHLAWPNYLVSAFHVLIYLAIFMLARIVIERIWPGDVVKPAHPLLVQALSFHKPVVAATCGALFFLTSIGHQELFGPVVFMFIGIIFNIYGRFSSKFIVWISWSYILLGTIFGCLAPTGGPSLWIYFDLYLGLSFVTIGAHLLKEKKSRWRS
jgi:hypothetical protein